MPEIIQGIAFVDGIKQLKSAALIKPSPTFGHSSWFFRFDISDLLLVEDQQTAHRSLRQCPNFREQLMWRSMKYECVLPQCFLDRLTGPCRDRFVDRLIQCRAPAFKPRHLDPE